MGVNRRRVLQQISDYIYRQQATGTIARWVGRNVILDRLDLEEEDLIQQAKLIDLETAGRSTRYFIWQVIGFLRKSYREERVVGMEFTDQPVPCLTSNLTRDERHLLFLMSNEYTYREIADIMGITKSTVHRMVDQLRRKYEIDRAA